MDDAEQMPNLEAGAFGEVGGRPIRNQHTILQDIDRALKRNKPPAIEYILVRPA